MVIEDTPLQNVREYCNACDDMGNILENLKNGNLTQEDLIYIRKKCMYCKFQKKGIYKADAIINLLEKRPFMPNKGRKPTKVKQYGETVKNLRGEGHTVREIAKIVGISTTTVQKILNPR